VSKCFLGRTGIVGRRGRHGRKLKLKETEPENGRIALRMK
jgi:hypothetical protein